MTVTGADLAGAAHRCGAVCSHPPADLRDVHARWRAGVISDDELVEFVAALPLAVPDSSLPEGSSRWRDDFVSRLADPGCRQFAHAAVAAGWFDGPIVARLLGTFRHPTT